MDIKLFRRLEILFVDMSKRKNNYDILLRMLQSVTNFSQLLSNYDKKQKNWRSAFSVLYIYFFYFLSQS